MWYLNKMSTFTCIQLKKSTTPYTFESSLIFKQFNFFRSAKERDLTIILGQLQLHHQKIRIFG